MTLIEEYNRRWEFFRNITGVAMTVHREYKHGLLESAYEAALKYLLELDGHTVERQKYLPIFWKQVQLEQHYRMDLVVDGNIIVELKAVGHVETAHRRQLFNYMNLTHQPYGMIINFGAPSLYAEWYFRYEDGRIEKIKLM
jgi:GxxExxY protein